MDDAIGWILLAIVTAITQSKFDPMKFATMIASVLVFGAVMFFVVRPVAIRWITTSLKRNGGIPALGTWKLRIRHLLRVGLHRRISHRGRILRLRCSGLHGNAPAGRYDGDREVGYDGRRLYGVCADGLRARPRTGDWRVRAERDRVHG
jgi:hypothetical protein